jgi:hypothetical protein
MIVHERNKIVLEDKEYDIVRTEVWWQGPTGLVPTLSTALAVHKALYGNEGLLFAQIWRAIPVAITDSGLFEELR